MDSITRVVAKAGRRLFVIDVLHTLAVTSAVSLCAVLAVLAVEKLGPPMTLPWLWIGVGALSAAVLGSLTWSLLRRPAALAVARTVDEHAGLRETLSTAMHVSSAQDPWSRAVVTNAERAAVAVDVNRALPVTWSRLWSVPVALGLALAAVWWLPGYDLTGLQQQQAANDENQRQIEAVVSEVRLEQEQLAAVMREAGLELDAVEGDTDFKDVGQAASTPDDVRRAALRKLTSLSEQIKQQQEGAKGKEMSALRDAMRQLKAPGDGPMSELARKMARGNFSEAKKIAEDLQNKLDTDSMSAEQREQMKEALDQLSSQLDSMAKDESAMQQALQSAGMSAEQAKQALQNPQTLQKALEQMQSMTPQQMQSLMNQAQGMQNAQQTMSQMASAMDQMAQQCSNPSASQNGQSGGQKLSDQLSASEMLQNEMDSLQQAMDMASKQMQQQGDSMCENPGGDGSNPGQGGQGNQGPGKTGRFAEGTNQQAGSGSGGAGKGNGASPDSEQADYALKRERDIVGNRGGPVIGSTVVYGGQVRGESTQAFRAAVVAAEASATEAIETMAVPPEYHNSVKRYFGTMEKATSSSPAASSAQTPPASDAAAPPSGGSDD